MVAMSTLRRLLSGVGATAGLLLLLVGAPWALCVWGKVRLLADIDWAHIFSVPDDGRLMQGLLSLVGWVAWLVLAFAILIELFEVLDRVNAQRTKRPHRPLFVPGLDLPRLIVRGLVVAAVTAAVGLGPVKSASAFPQGIQYSMAQEQTSPALDSGRSMGGSCTGPSSPMAPTQSPLASLHVVAPDEDVRDLALRYYGDATKAQLIVEANRDLIKDGQKVGVGWRLVIPGVASPDGTTVVVVARGDSLSKLAAAHLGDGDRWPEIFALNEEVITNPDLLFQSWRLRIPVDTPVTPAVATELPSEVEESSAVTVPPTAETTASPAGTTTSPPDAAPIPAAASPSVMQSTSGSATPSAFASQPEWLAPTASALSPEPPTSSALAVPSVTAIPATAVASPSEPSSPSATTSGIEAARSASPVAMEPVAAPTTGATPTALTESVQPEPQTEAPKSGLLVSQALAFGIIGTVGAGLAAAAIRTIRRRRDVALALRLPGRRILFPAAPTMLIESALAVLGHDAKPQPSSPLANAEESPARIEEPPPPVDESPSRSASTSEHPEASLPVQTGQPARHAFVDTAWACVTAGITSTGSYMLDLEAHRLVLLDLGDEETTWGTACAWALELACKAEAGAVDQTAHGATIVAVGPIGDVLSAAELESVVCINSVQAAIDDLTATTAQQRSMLETAGWDLEEARLDPDAGGAWMPRVYVFGAVSEEELWQIEQALQVADQTAVSVLLALPGTEDLVVVNRGARIAGTADSAVISPDDVVVRPISLSAMGTAGLVELLRTSGSDETTPAPWYDHGGDSENVVPLIPRFDGSMKEVVDMGDDSPGVTDFSHPTLMLLGPILLVGAAGQPPTRAERSCIEYCTWMVEHPGATASQMAAALLVAESTRRSNVSRLRGWLGLDVDGRPYLPEAYTGRLYLEPLVSSDWQRLQALIGPGVNRVPISTLVSALKLVRGAPLADAAPGQWHWAEEMRVDMVSTIRDIGVRVGEAALDEGNIDLARWAAGRALMAAPGDEILMRLRLRTEHRAGNRFEVERIVLQLTRHARVLGIDLDDETVLAIQEAIEGQPRARAYS